MKIKITMLWIIIIFLTIFSGIGYANEQIYLDNSMLPLIWSINSIHTASVEQIQNFSKKLGGEISSIKNYLIDTGSDQIKINIIDCDSESDAKKIYNYLRTVSGSKDKYQIKGKNVIEIVGSDFFINKAKDILDLYDDSIIQYTVKFSFAPVNEIKDYMQYNQFSNLLVSYSNNPDNQVLEKQIKDLSKNFEFGDSIFLFAEHLPWGSAIYSFSSPVDKFREVGDISYYTFDINSFLLDIPIVNIEAEIPIKPFTSYNPSDPINTIYLTSASKFWPVEDQEIQNLVQEIINKNTSIKEKTEQILQWIHNNIEYGGQQGSRYGVKQVLKQKFGRCLDFSDLFITLSRAANIPARLVTGWIYKFAGHAWVEVYIPNEGWISLDPTATWLGVSEDYLPFVISENGDIPLLYWDFPKIQKLKD